MFLVFGVVSLELAVNFGNCIGILNLDSFLLSASKIRGLRTNNIWPKASASRAFGMIARVAPATPHQMIEVALAEIWDPYDPHKAVVPVFAPSM